MIGRPKGGKNRKYTVEEKLSIVNIVNVNMNFAKNVAFTFTNYVVFNPYLIDQIRYL